MEAKCIMHNHKSKRTTKSTTDNSQNVIRTGKDSGFKTVFGNAELIVEFLWDFVPIGPLKNLTAADIEDVNTRYLPLTNEVGEACC
jgi:hypothetical protein